MTTKTSTSNTENIRRATLKMLSAGLASPNEIAEIADVSRQLVYYWYSTDELNWHVARKAYLTKQWHRLLSGSR